MHSLMSSPGALTLPPVSEPQESQVVSAPYGCGLLEGKDHVFTASDNEPTAFVTYLAQDRFAAANEITKWEPLGQGELAAPGSRDLGVRVEGTPLGVAPADPRGRTIGT